MTLPFFTIAAIACLLVFSAYGAGAPHMLRNSDFVNGTVIIDQPGLYLLAEDITFNPNSAEQLGRDAYSSGMPLPEQFASNGGIYDDDAYRLGFFAAIAVAANHVIIDLNGFTFEQSKEHALQQRFFALIELADQPFIAGQGPNNFGDEIFGAQHVTIRNGVLGRSAHHGIHGNDNRQIMIRDLSFIDYEVAAVSLNGVRGLRVLGCTAVNRKDVPVVGTFSSGRFITPFIDFLEASGSTTTLTVQGTPKTITDIRSDLQTSINNVHEDLIVNDLPEIDPTAHPDEYALFHNSLGVVDGNCYGFLIHSAGFAVNGFATIDEENASCDIVFKDVYVRDARCSINEVITIKRNGKDVIDPIGAVFQVKNLHPDTEFPVTVSSPVDSEAVYLGNAIANAQAFVAKAILNGDFDGSGIDTSRNRIDAAVLAWIEADPNSEEATLANLTAAEGYICNADSMFHVNKGAFGFRIDGARNVVLKFVYVDGLENLGKLGSGVCGRYSKSHDLQVLEGYGGAVSRGFSFAGTSKVSVSRTWARNIKAANGEAIGFDVLTDSRLVNLRSVSSHDIVSGEGFEEELRNPTPGPNSLGFKIGRDASRVQLTYFNVDGLESYGDTCEVESKSTSVKVNNFVSD